MRFPSFMLAALLALVPTVAACQQLPDPTIAWSAADSDVPFHLYQGNRVVARGAVNGHEVEFLLDTGAGVTTIDKAFARSIGIAEGQKVPAQGAGGMSEAELVQGVSLTFGGLKLTNVTAAVIDLSDVSKAIGRPLDVVLGRELFDHAIVSIDWEAGKLGIADPAKFKPAASARLIALENDGELNSVPVAIDGLPPVMAVLDLGNGGAISLPENYWSKQPKLSGLRYAEVMSGGVGGQHVGRATTLPTVDFGGQRFTAVPATLHGPVPEGAVNEINLGIGMLKPFRVTMDLGHDKLYLEPLPNVPPFVRDRSGIRTSLSDGKLAVRYVSPQGPGAPAGLKKGDGIVAINGVTVDAGFSKGPLNDWTRAAAGTTYKLTMEDGRSVTLTLADYF